MAEQWHNRISGYGEESPDTLLANPRNFRRHPKHQQDALAGVLRDVGVVQNVIVNRTTGLVVDGHARIALAIRDGQTTIPITYVELSEAEESLVLATLDPIAALATIDAEILENLLREVTTGDAAVQAMLDALAVDAGIVPDDTWADVLGGLPDGDKSPFQQMTFTVSDAQADTIKQALRRAQKAEAFIDTGNENSNGNALARICEAYNGEC